MKAHIVRGEATSNQPEEIYRSKCTPIQMVMLHESSCYSFVTLDGALLAISRSLGLVLKSAFSKENREHCADV